jgi:type II secretory pathway pseudopilin PulG
LVELLVVIATIGLLLAVLLPGIQAARSSAHRTQCSNNLRQLALAGLSYHEARDSFPPGLEQLQFATPPRYRGTSLFAFLLPHLEQGNVISDWHFESPLRNAEGGQAAPTATVLTVLLCPSDLIETNPVDVGGRYFGITSYAGNGGSRSFDPDRATVDGIFHTTGPASEPQPNQQPVTSGQIRDGTSHTVLFGERSHQDANYESFAGMHWTESLEFLGRWAAIGGRRRIADVTLSAFAPINYQLPFSYTQRLANPHALNSSREFALYEDRRMCAFGSNHAGGALFAFADGSVHFLSDSMARQTLQAFCTRAGGEVTADP